LGGAIERLSAKNLNPNKYNKLGGGGLALRPFQGWVLTYSTFFFIKIIIFLYSTYPILRSRLYKITEIVRFLSNNLYMSEKSITFVP
jgi:hypothetical protein